LLQSVDCECGSGGGLAWHELHVTAAKRSAALEIRDRALALKR
jgi:hypothetical protein